MTATEFNDLEIQFARALSTISCLFLVILRDAVLYDVVFDHCTPGSIFKVGKTCKTGHAAAQEYVKRVFNIHKHLRRFVPNPLSFRSLQAKTGSVISGSNALQFLERDVYPQSDMDVYVTVEYALSVCNYLMSEEGGGYRLQTRASKLPTLRMTWHDFFRDRLGMNGPDGFQRAWSHFVRSWAPRQVQGVMREPHLHQATLYGSQWVTCIFSFGSHWSGEERTVQVVVTYHDPLSAILSFHSTVVMNAITHNAAYSLFPKATFEERVNLQLARGRQRDNDAQIVAKYTERGWTPIEYTQNYAREVKDDSTFHHGKRWITDAHSWVLPLDASSLSRSEQRTTNAFSLGSFNLFYDDQVNMSCTRFSIVNRSFLAGLKTRITVNFEMMDKILLIQHEMEDAVERLGPDSRLSSSIVCDAIVRHCSTIAMNLCRCEKNLHTEKIQYTLLNRPTNCPAYVKILQLLPEMIELAVQPRVSATTLE